MRAFKKIIFILAVVITVPAAAILLVRGINRLRYPEPESGLTFPEDTNTYPLADADGEISLIDHKRAQGLHLKPKNKTRKGAVVVFGGSEGSLNYDMADKLYREGYEVLALYFFGKNNLPQTLNLIDISFFDDVKEYLTLEDIEPQPITVLGISKGAELALLLTQYYDFIDNIVLYSPSVYVFQGLDFNSSGSSWSYNGEEITYLSFQTISGKGIRNMMGAMLFNYPISYRETYRSISNHASSGSEEWIYKKPISGNVLAFAGSEDKMWPSDVMGAALKEAYPDQVEFHLYENAGHIFKNFSYASGFSFGGTPRSNLEAGEKSDRILLEALSGWHK